MTLRALRVGSIEGWQLYDDADFDEGVFCEGPIKAGTPVSSADVLRLADIGVGGVVGDVNGPATSAYNQVARFNSLVGQSITTSLVSIDNSGNVTIANGAYIGQTSGPKLTFDDTNNFLEISDCDVGIGLTSPLGKLHVRDGSGYNLVVLQYSGQVAISAEYDGGSVAQDLAIYAADVLIPNGSLGLGAAPTFSDGEGIYVDGKILRIYTSKTVASAGASGYQGEICWDSNHIYVCVAFNTWKRATLATW